jgi:hypothetical protein
MRALPVLLLLVPMFGATPVAAQDTRTALLEQLRAERAKAAVPYEPTTIEHGLLLVEEHRILERLAGGLYGFYPHMGDFPTGSGLGIGLGFRTSVLNDHWSFDAATAGSLKGYKRLQASTALPRLFGGRLEIGGSWAWTDYPQEDFFGLGGSSTLADRTSYRLRGHEMSGHATLKPVWWLSAGSRVGLLHADVSAGTDDRLAVIHDRFTDDTAPGLGRAPRIGYHQVFLDVDYRDEPGNTRGGGRYRVRRGWYDDRRSGAFDFGRTDAELLQVFPVFDGKRNFAVRVQASHIEADSAARVPFFLMPSVGGSESLRGFREHRFRDANYVILNGEYRWEAFSALDLALFFDAADVAPRWEDLALNTLKTSWGVGLRFNTNRQVFLRLDIGTGGREGTRFFLKFGPAF